MSYLSIDMIICFASAGSTLEQAIKSAIHIALEHKCNVQFIHNTTKYLVNYHKLISIHEAIK